MLSKGLMKERKKERKKNKNAFLLERLCGLPVKKQVTLPGCFQKAL
jgi:hypothetical protein